MKWNTLNIHLDVLDKKGQDFLGKLLPFVKNTDFILGGGTALSLRIIHHKSFDFDFFSHQEIKKNLIEKLHKIMSISNISVDSQDELMFFTKREIKI